MDVPSFVRENRYDIIVVSVLLIAGLVTRFLGISYQSIWIDEGATYYYSQFSWDQFMDDPEPNSPAYYMMQGVVFDLLGTNEFAMRFVSALSSAFTVPLVYLLCRKVVGNGYVSILAAAITLASPIMIEYGQEGRGYAPMVLLFVCQMIVILYALERPGWRYWILLSVLSALNLAMHYMSIVATLTVYGYALVYLRKDWLKKRFCGVGKAVASGVLALILSSPLLMHAVAAAGESSSHEHWDWCFIGMRYLYHLLIDFLFDFDYFLLAVAVVLVICGAVILVRRDREQGILICWITVVPALLSTLASFSMNMTPRYVLWGAVGMYVMLACCVLAFTGDDTRKLRRNAVVAAVAVVAIAAICLPSYYTDITKSDFRGGAETLEEYVQEGDTVLYAPDWTNMVYGSITFYFDPEDRGAEMYGVYSDDDFKSHLASATGTVYVIILQEYQPFGLLEENESSGCERVYEAFRITVWKVTGPIA